MKQIINLGSGPGANNGDTARVGGQKINDNFSELYNSIDLLIGDSPVYNKIQVETGFSLVGQNITINSNWQWIIGNIKYSNIANVVINIPFCSTGKSRIDYIIPNSSNSFIRIAGVESSEIPVAPAIPNEGMYVTFFVVYDGVIGEPSSSMILGIYNEDFTYISGPQAFNIPAGIAVKSVYRGGLRLNKSQYTFADSIVTITYDTLTPNDDIISITN